jgi:hypothetical protein
VRRIEASTGSSHPLHRFPPGKNINSFIQKNQSCTINLQSPPDSKSLGLYMRRPLVSEGEPIQGGFAALELKFTLK